MLETTAEETLEASATGQIVVKISIVLVMTAPTFVVRAGQSVIEAAQEVTVKISVATTVKVVCGPAGPAVLAPAVAATVEFWNGGRTVEVTFEALDPPVVRGPALDADKLVTLAPELSDTEVAVALVAGPAEAVALSAGAFPVGTTTAEEPTLALAEVIAVALEPNPTEAVALRAGAAPLGVITAEAGLLSDAVALAPEFSDTEVALKPDPTEAVALRPGAAPLGTGTAGAVALRPGAAPLGTGTAEAVILVEAAEEPTVALAEMIAVAFKPDPAEAVALRPGAAPLGTTTPEADVLKEANEEDAVALAPEFSETEVTVVLEPNPTEAVALRPGAAPLGTGTTEAVALRPGAAPLVTGTAEAELLNDAGEPAVALAPEFWDTEVAVELDTDPAGAVWLKEAVGTPTLALAEVIAVILMLPPAMAEATTEELIFEADATGQIVYRRMLVHIQLTKLRLGMLDLQLSKQSSELPQPQLIQSSEQDS
jgi:hypothetical protein